jgi:hypothetical protein
VISKERASPKPYPTPLQRAAAVARGVAGGVVRPLCPAGLGRGKARSGRRWKQVVAAAAVLWSLEARLSTRASAAETNLHVVLRYAVDASVRGCWDEAQFRRSVAQRIGYDPFREDASLDVRIHVGGTELAVDGLVEWRKANGVLMGERRFIAKDGDCVKLLTEMSFATGLQIELLRPKAPAGVGASTVASGGVPIPSSAPIPSVAAAPPASVATAAAPSPTAQPAAAPPSFTPHPSGPSASASQPNIASEHSSAIHPREKTSDEGVAAAPKASPRWPMWVGIGPSLAWRLSPAVTADARLFLGIQRNDLSLEIGTEVSYPSTERRWDGSGFRQMLVGGTLALCRHQQSFSACALGRASQVRVYGLGVDRPRSPNGFVAQAGLRLAATMELGSAWFLAAHLDGLGLLTPSTVVLNQAAAWKMPRLGGLAGIELLARFR